ncbi:hypothetical protein E2C01_037183 [Portunus trituberculatus]|uniref:Uncharacterized protein n=1 Tax=Portunus trituberculatus TaxID=210409 RepID=A0A5B7FGE4_PORTR|nr:hypothetical protein [Portunus trituberculatus]
MFELRNEEGMFQKLLTNHLHEDYNKFAEIFCLSVEQFDFLVELIKDDISKKSFNTPSKSNDRLRLQLYSPPSCAAIWGQR